MKKIFFIIALIFVLVNKVQAIDINDNINNLNSLVDNLSSEINILNNSRINKFYPVGSIYISTSSTNPSSLFGGTWQSFGQGRKLVGVGSNGTTNYTNGSQSGSSTKSITTSNIPSHSHTITPSGTVTSSFTGKSVNTNSTGSHSHTMPYGNASGEAKGYGLKPNASSQTWGTNWDVIAVDTTNSYGYNTELSGAHTHTMKAQGTVSSRFTGSSATTSSVGSTSSFNIQNPYITVYMWKRVS